MKKEVVNFQLHTYKNANSPLLVLQTTRSKGPSSTSRFQRGLQSEILWSQYPLLCLTNVGIGINCKKNTGPKGLQLRIS
jgi:hypothetical protein